MPGAETFEPRNPRQVPDASGCSTTVDSIDRCPMVARPQMTAARPKVASETATDAGEGLCVVAARSGQERECSWDSACLFLPQGLRRKPPIRAEWCRWSWVRPQSKGLHARGRSHVENRLYRRDVDAPREKLKVRWSPITSTWDDLTLLANPCDSRNEADPATGTACGSVNPTCSIRGCADLEVERTWPGIGDRSEQAGQVGNPAGA